MEVGSIINFLYGNRKDYLCFNLIKEKLEYDFEFKKIIEEGIINNKIVGFDEDLWNTINIIKTRTYKSFFDVFKDGMNIGSCTFTSEELSYGFKKVDLVSGIMKYIKGSKSSLNGEHSWIEDDYYIYDTSLLLIIDKSYKDKMGYVEYRRIDSNFLYQNKMYEIAKEFAFRDGNYKYYRSNKIR